MIKKLAALALALLMTLSMAACGSQKDDQAGGNVTPGVTDDAVPDMGTVSGGTYTNRFAGISCTLDDSGTSTPMSRSTSSTALSARAPATRS